MYLRCIWAQITQTSVSVLSVASLGGASRHASDAREPKGTPPARAAAKINMLQMSIQTDIKSG